MNLRDIRRIHKETGGKREERKIMEIFFNVEFFN